ncbi:MAG: exodeoxyribonuclease V subunit gamma [Actinomycetota bacterium]|nr:exodeoxyribonuclease V subunit gamma [Actinomycetota bacterium]
MLEEKKLILGKFSPGLEECLADIAREGKRENPLAPLTVLVGSEMLKLHLEKALTEKLGGWANIRIFTLHDFSKRLLEARQLDFKELPDSIRKLIVEKVTQKENLGDFSSSASFPGFADALLSTFKDMESARFAMPPPDSLDAKSSLKEANTRVKTAARLYEKYSLEITGSDKEKMNILEIASSFAEDVPRVFSSDEVVFYGFYDFNAIQKHFLRSLSKTRSILFLLPYEEGNDSYEYAQPLIRWLEGIGFEKTILQSSEQPPLSNLEILKRKGKSPPTKISRDSDDTVQIISAPGERREVQEIAREVLYYWHEKGIPFEEMAVILKHPETYGRLVVEEFERLGIPYYSSCHSKLSQTPEARSLILLCEIALSGIKRSKVMDFLKACPLSIKDILRRELKPGEVDLWDKISVDAGVIGTKEQWRSRLKRFIESGKPTSSEARDFLSMIEYILEVVEKIPEKSNISGFLSPIIEAYSKIVSPSEHKKSAPGEKDTDTKDFVLEEMENLTQFEASIGEFNFESFVSLIKEHLANREVNKGNFKRGGVNVLEIMKARGTSFQVVFIPGIVEKGFPDISHKGGILPDEDRKMLNRGGRFFSSSEDCVKEEKLLFSLAVQTAKEHLVLSYPRLDPGSGSPRLPSFFLIKAAQSYTNERVNYETLEDTEGFHRVPLLPVCHPPERSLSLEEYHLTKVLSPSQEERLAWREHVQKDENVKKGYQVQASRYSAWCLTSYDGLVGKVAEEWAKERVFSARELEDYARCPYSYFLSHFLEIKDFEPPEEVIALQPARKGSLVHTILRDFFSSASKLGLLPLKEEDQDKHLQILHEVCSKNFALEEADLTCGLPASWEVEKENITSLAKLVIYEETSLRSDFIPTFFEIPFGEPETENLEIRLDDGSKIRVRGRIDRIDLANDRNKLKVIDYKTGSANQKSEDPFRPKSEKRQGLYLQGMIYLLAAPAITGVRSAKSMEAEIYYISKGFAKDKTSQSARVKYGGEQFLEHGAKLKHFITLIFEGIKGGFFFPMPSQNCDFCNFQKACPEERKIIYGRKKYDPAIGKVKELFLDTSENTYSER